MSTSPVKPSYSTLQNQVIFRLKVFFNILNGTGQVLIARNQIYYSVPDRGAEYGDECVCVRLFVCLRSYLRKNTSDLHQIFVHVTYGRGSVLLWRHSDKLRTSGFTDDVIFAHKLRLLKVAARLRQ